MAEKFLKMSDVNRDGLGKIKTVKDCTHFNSLIAFQVCRFLVFLHFRGIEQHKNKFY